MTIERIKTGIRGYDMMLGGGYLPNTVNLISGCSGAGKTLFAISFLYNGVERYDHDGVYITLEEGKAQIIRNCESIGINLDEIKDGKLAMFDIASLRKMYTVKEEFEREDSPLNVDILIDLIKRNCDGAKRVVIDSLVPLSLRYPEMNEFRSEMNVTNSTRGLQIQRRLKQ